jgi:FlaA1/EpsC-like NDP-sugar epimerase
MNENTFLKNKKILVTGGSGSIGSAIVKYLLKMECNTIRVMSNDENGIYELSEEINNLKQELIIINNKKFRDKMFKTGVRYLIGDIRDYKRCLNATRKINIVIHAAAMKHVPLCEYNPLETKKTNILGTKNLINAALKNNVKKFILISTDKVVDPSSVMGKSKKIAENLVITKQQRQKKMIILAIRFGNILFSRGSVIFKFIKQIKDKKPLTVTGKRMSRFFITVDQAVEKILTALRLSTGGQIFIIPKMNAFKIIDLAKAIKNIYKKNNKIVIVKPREGEKNYEKLLNKNEEISQIFENQNLAIISKKKKLSKSFIIDSRYEKHLSVSEIKKVLLKQKIKSF